MTVPLNRLAELIEETVKQVTAGAKGARDKGYAYVQVPEGIAFSIEVVASDGTNAVARTQESSLSAPRVTEVVEPESTQKTTQTGHTVTRTEKAATTTKTRKETNPEVTETTTQDPVTSHSAQIQQPSTDATVSSQSQTQEHRTTQGGGNNSTTTYDVT